MENLNPLDSRDNIQFNSVPVVNSGQMGDVSVSEHNNPALHFFLYLGNFLSLIFVASGVGAILYQMINKMFPDKVSSYTNMFSEAAIKFGLASIIIATPIFFILSYIINKYLFEGKILEGSKVRKWITYIVLFAAFATFLGDLVSLVYGWLGGDMTARFVLKVLVILFISGFILGYYFWDMRRKNLIGRIFPENKIIGFLCFIIILIIFVSSFFVVDSPSLSRDKKSDSAIISKMTNYKYSIDSYYSKNKTLPKNLSEVESMNSFSYNQQENMDITYKPTGIYTYQLCADFKTSNLTSDTNGGLYYEKEWKHDKGNKCFDGEISQYNRTNNLDKTQSQQNIQQPDPAYMQVPQVQSVNNAVSSNVANNKPETVGISFTVKDRNGKLLEGITCAVKGDRGTTKMVSEISQKTDSKGQCNFKDLDSTVPYLVRVYWTADQSRVSDISLSWIPAGTTITREVVKPENM